MTNEEKAIFSEYYNKQKELAYDENGRIVDVAAWHCAVSACNLYSILNNMPYSFAIEELTHGDANV